MRIFEGFQKGVNLGGWISQFAEYDREYFAYFITEKDIAEIAALGFDHVRVPVDYTVLEDEEGTPGILVFPAWRIAFPGAAEIICA